MVTLAVREKLSVPRWVMDGRGGPHYWSLSRGCPCCGNMHSTDHVPCPPAACMLCGTLQCFSNGSGNGRCKCCGFGFIPGWSGNSGECGYARCTEPAVAVIPGKKRACLAHATARVGDAVKASLAQRDSGKGWEHWTFTGPRADW